MSDKKSNRHQSMVRHKRFHVSSSEREFITVNLALLLKAALPIGEALASIGDATKSRSLKHAIDQMQADINAGSSLWKTLDNTGVFPTQTIALVRIGEQSGNLVENLRIAVAQEAKQRALKSKIRAALLYPTFVLGLTFVIGLGVAWFLLPRLSETFGQLGVSLPWISKVVIGIGVFLKTNGWWAIPSIIGGMFLLGLLLFGLPTTRILGQRLLLHVPGVSRLVREIELARFGHLTGSLLNSGLSIVQALELMGQATNSPAYRSLYKHLATSFGQGYTFREGLRAFKRSNKLIPPPVQQIVIAGERSGSLADSLESIGATYEERADITTRSLEAMLEPILLLIVAGGVMAVAVAIILPIYSLTSNLGG